MLEIVLSGPQSSRAVMLATLDQAGVQVGIRPVNPNHHLPVEQDVSWITCLASGLGDVESVLARVPDWSLRMHYRKAPRVVRPDPVKALEKRVAELEARLK